MGISKRKLYEICAEYGLNMMDFTSCAILNNWHNEGPSLEQSLEESQTSARDYQRPLIVFQDPFNYNESVSKLLWDKQYADKMLGFYNNTIVKKSNEKSSIKKAIKGLVYQWKLYWNEPTP